MQEGETVQIRIESNTMGSEVDMEEESQPVDEVEEVHENVVMAGETINESESNPFFGRFFRAGDSQWEVGLFSRALFRLPPRSPATSRRLLSVSRTPVR